MLDLLKHDSLFIIRIHVYTVKPAFKNENKMKSSIKWPTIAGGCTDQVQLLGFSIYIVPLHVYELTKLA